MTQKLAELINKVENTASTLEGKAWLTKALHPSDPVTDCKGIPDESSCTTVMLGYNCVYRLTPPNQVDPWEFDITILPDVIIPAFITKQSFNSSPALSNFMNPAFTPPGVLNPTYAQLFAQFRSMGIEAHRLVYMGISVYQDGPALANQGTLAAAQWHVARKKWTLGPCAIGTSLSNATAFTRCISYTHKDFALYESSQLLPNAYFGQSKDGCYLPLRLSGNCRWRTEADLELPFFNVNPNQEDFNYNDFPYQNTVAQRPSIPYPGIATPFWDNTSGLVGGDKVFKPLNDIWAGISARNVSPQSSFAFYFRIGIEARVSPTSLLVSQVKMSPNYDPGALASYYKINRELKDAYPVDYNDLGKLWDVIKTAARVAIPVLKNVPFVGGLATGAEALMNIIDAPSNEAKKTKTNARDKPAAVAVERQREQAVVKAANKRQQAKGVRSQRRVQQTRRRLVIAKRRL